MRIAKPIEASGYFWLPSDENNRHPGVLRISEAGHITVELQDKLLPDVLLVDVVRLLGEVDGLGGITLEECRSESWSYSALEKHTLRARYVLKGIHYEEGESITFSKAIFSVDGLSEWLSVSGFTLDGSLFNRDKPLNVSFQLPAPINVGTSNDITMKFVFAVRGPTRRKTITEVGIEQTAHVALESIEPIDIDDMMSLAFKLRDLFRFAISKPVSIHSFMAQTDEVTREANGVKHRVPIAVYGESPHHSETIPSVDSGAMLFRYTDVRNIFGMIVSQWLDSYERYRPTFDLYFASVFGLPAYREVRLLWLTQALEALHRGSSDETVMLEHEFSDVVQTLLSTCPSERRNWLEQELRYGNELSLRQRIKRLMLPFRQYFGNNKERRAIIDKIVNTRNYLTHYDDTLRDDAAVGPEISHLCNRLDGLLQLNLLKIMGLSDESILSVLRESGPISRKLGLHEGGGGKRRIATLVNCTGVRVTTRLLVGGDA